MGKLIWSFLKVHVLTLLHSERPKLCAILAFLSAIGLKSFGGVYLVKVMHVRQFSALLSKIMNKKKDNKKYMLTLNVPITTAADDIHKYFFTVVQRK